MIRILHRRPEPEAPPQPRVGLALGAGGSKGFAHIGVLRVLQEAGIHIDVISGTSVGAIVGALYAAGFDLDQIHEGMHGADRRLRRWTVSTTSLWSDRGLRELLEQAGADTRFEDLNMPFAAVVTDLTGGGCRALDTGPLWPAVQASAAIPGIFPPSIIEGHYLVDGGMVCPVPVDAARALGADIVIAVDLGDSEPMDSGLVAPWPLRGRKPHLVGLLRRARQVQQWQIDRSALRAADAVIRPGIPGWRWQDFSQNGVAYATLGEEAARSALPAIEALLSGGLVVRAG